MMPRDFLFGFVRVPMWDYYWGLTAAQVELLMIDRPTVVYKADKDNDKPWKNGTVSESYRQKQYRIWEEKKRKREQEGRNIDVEKMLKNGKRSSLGHYVATGEK